MRYGPFVKGKFGAERNTAFRGALLAHRRLRIVLPPLYWGGGGTPTRRLTTRSRHLSQEGPGFWLVVALAVAVIGRGVDGGADSQVILQPMA